MGLVGRFGRGLSRAVPPRHFFFDFSRWRAVTLVGWSRGSPEALFAVPGLDPIGVRALMAPARSGARCPVDMTLRGDPSLPALLGEPPSAPIGEGRRFRRTPERTATRGALENECRWPPRGRRRPIEDSFTCVVLQEDTFNIRCCLNDLLPQA